MSGAISCSVSRSGTTHGCAGRTLTDAGWAACFASVAAKCHTQLQDTSPVDIAETTLRADLAAGRFCVGRYKVTTPADFPHLQILVPTDFRFSWCLQILRTQIFCAEVSTFRAQVQGSPVASCSQHCDV